MTNCRNLVLAVVILLSVAACSTGPRIVANRAPGFDLSNYATYGYFSPLSTDLGTTRSINSSVLIEATDEQLQLRGLVRDDADPDLLVNFIGATREKITSRPTATPSMYYGRSRYGTWGGYGIGMGNTTEIVQRTEGTLSVDIVDAERDELVWEGAATAVITESMRKNRREGLTAAIRDIFKEFP
jgi:hypothetical protein